MSLLTLDYGTTQWKTMALSMEELKKGYLEWNSEVAADTLAKGCCETPKF